MKNIFLALSSDLPFKLAYKRACHVDNGHPLDKSTLVEKFSSEKHPHTDSQYIYTINIMKCDDCGLFWNDCGLELRER